MAFRLAWNEFKSEKGFDAMADAIAPMRVAAGVTWLVLPTPCNTFYNIKKGVDKIIEGNLYEQPS